jgi:tRNA(adenine34) deaminase
MPYVMPGFMPGIHAFIHDGTDKAVDDRSNPAAAGRSRVPSFMELALEEARKAQDRGEVPVGCVVVRDGAVLAAAGNRTLADHDPTAHAEMLAIRAATRALGSERLTGCDLYVTLEPCAMCAGAISFARIRRLYYGAADPKGGAIEHGPRLFEQPTCHHRPDTYGGMSESASADLLRGFFEARRG